MTARTGRACDRVRAVVLDEPRADRIVINYLAGEPHHGKQHGRALVSVRIGAHIARLRRQAERAETGPTA
jgi:hypothetical protein